MKTTQKRLARAVTLAMMTSATSTAWAQPLDLGLLGGQGIRIDGASSGDFAGGSVTGAGDVNGDGIPDLVVGAIGADGTGGEAYVVFGRTEPGTIDLGNLGTGGFAMIQNTPGDVAGASVSGAGDVNGDGLDDLIVGIPGVAAYTGKAVVVFGKSDALPVSLGDIRNDGFTIVDNVIGARLGISVSGAGDVNGDGLDDIVIGHPYTNYTPPNQATRFDTGNAYIIFGKDDSRTVEVDDLGEGGTTIMGIFSGHDVGQQVSGAGDVNGDGLADVLIGARRGNRTYVIFGQEVANTVRVDALGLKGYEIQSGTVSAVAGAGDVNGDGYSDILIGSNYAAGDAGEAYVVFGKPDLDTVSVTSLGNGGFTINTDSLSGFLGTSLAGAGDVNGDGLADVIIGAPRAEYTNTTKNGMAYLVYGKTDNAGVDLANPDTGHRYLIGGALDDAAGRSVASAGDVNGDGLADVLVGAPDADPGGDASAGAAYLVFSSIAPEQSFAIYRQWTGPDNTPRTAIGVSGDRSNHTTPDSRVWIDFVDGRGFLTAHSLQSVVVHRDGSPLPNPGVDMYWRTTTGRRDYDNVTVSFKYLENELLIPNEADLRLFFSDEIDGPYTALPTTLDTSRNTLSARVSNLGFFFIGQRPPRPDALFADSFE